MNKMLPPALSRPIAVAVGLLAGSVNLSVFAHGYVSESERRSYLCKLDDNTGCGAVQWEPQSVEGPDRKPRIPIEGLLMVRTLPSAHLLGQSRTRSRHPYRHASLCQDSVRGSKDNLSCLLNTFV